MRIIEIEVENLKRLVAVDITPTDGVVPISGKNSQGKSSLLDSIEWAFAGAGSIQREPIRRGQEKGRVKVKVGGNEVEFIVERRFAKGKPSTLSVTTADGFTPPGGAQTAADAFIGAISFDPLAFDRMKPAQQFEELLRVFPIGINPAEIDGLNATDYKRRTDINRDAKAARVKAEAITVAPDLPAEPIDEDRLLNEITDAADGNQVIEQRKAKRADTAREIENAQSRAQRDRDKASELRRQFEMQLEELLKSAQSAEAMAVSLQEKLDGAAKLPQPVDLSVLKAELNAAKVTNAAIADRQTRQRLEVDAQALEDQSKALTVAMEAREATKREAVAAAKFPVEGLGFGDGMVTFGGLPLDQASASERLKVSVAIAMAANPKLRVLLIRDGSLLDTDSRIQLETMVDDAGYQCWIELARDDEPSGFIIEDGTADIMTPGKAEENRAKREAAE